MRPHGFKSVAAVLLALACSGGGGTGPGSTNQPGANTPASVTKRTGGAQAALVGATVTITPTVTVTDAQARGIPGINVNFSATTGDVVGNATSLTGSDGVASAGSWKLGNTAGAHLLTAGVAGLVATAQFTATATAGPATTLVKLAGDAQSGFAGSNVTTAPSVTVSDAFGNPVSGANVTFAIGTGGGSLTGGAAVTSSFGAATVGSWRLGATPGANTLTATATGITPVTFTATGNADPCMAFTPITVGATVNGTLLDSDCLIDGQYYGDLYSFTLGASQGVQFDMTSTAFDAWLDIVGISADELFGSDDNGGGGTNPRVRLLAPPGTYIAMANSFAPAQVGAYSVTMAAWNGDPAACETDTWLIAGAPTYPMAIAATDCVIAGTGGPFYGDRINFVAAAGRTYTMTMASAAVDPLLRLYSVASGMIITSDDNGGGGTTAKIVYTPTATTFLVIVGTTAVGLTTGAFTLSVTQAGTAAALSLPLGKAPGARQPAFARVGAPWAFQPALVQRGAPSVHRP